MQKPTAGEGGDPGVLWRDVDELIAFRNAIENMKVVIQGPVFGAVNSDGTVTISGLNNGRLDFSGGNAILTIS